MLDTEVWYLAPDCDQPHWQSMISNDYHCAFTQSVFHGYAVGLLVFGRIFIPACEKMALLCRKLYAHGGANFAVRIMSEKKGCPGI
jgi:hypothetical protein